MSVTSWFLVSSSGTRHRLPREMIFVGREDCELMLQSRSVDKQHAVINYDPATNDHLVKDLGSLNGTFVNDLRIPDQTYITLKLSDVIRFGYDSHVYILERSQHRVPEEALKHEKYTSQLQMDLEATEVRKHEQTEENNKHSDSTHTKMDNTERSTKTASETPPSRPTPLYGQPSWWGEDEDEHNDQQQTDTKPPDCSHSVDPKEGTKKKLCASAPITVDQEKSIYSYRRDPSYFEIPTKEFYSRPKTAELQAHEAPTKDLDIPATPTPPVVQSHASFTIEFDDCTPGKIKIKDHVTKFSFRQRKQPGNEAATTPTEEMSVESKVADWLVQSDSCIMRNKFRPDDLYSTKSDLPINNKALADHYHEDGTQSDSEEPVLMEKQGLQSKLLGNPQRPFHSQQQQPLTAPDEKATLSTSPSPPQSQGKPEPQQAFVIEFFDQKKRSHSFTNKLSPSESNSGLRNRLEKKQNAVLPDRPSPIPNSNPPTQQFTIPLKDSPGPQRASSLRREKSDIRLSSSSFSSHSASGTNIRSFGSVGRRTKLAQDFAAELLKHSKKSATSSSTAITAPVTPALQGSSVRTVSTELPIPSRTGTEDKPTRGPRSEEDDSLSDAGTYTIEADCQDKEVVEARNMIDQVFGVDVAGHKSMTPGPVYMTDSTNGRQGQGTLHLSESSSASVQGPYPPDLSESPLVPQGSSGSLMDPGGQRWVSRWASLADGYSESGPVSGLFNIPAQLELSGGRIIHQAMLNRTFETESESSPLSSRARRVLPQLPSQEQTDCPPPSIQIQSNPYATYEVRGRRSKSPRQQSDVHKLRVGDDLEPDSLSDASKSDDGSVLEPSKTWKKDPGLKACENSWSDNRSKTRDISNTATSIYVKVEESESKPNQAFQEIHAKFSSATVTRQYSNKTLKPNASDPNLDVLQSNEDSPPLMRQESFTTFRTTSDYHTAQLPNISNEPPSSARDPADAFRGVCKQDTQGYLKDTEDVLAVLEAKLQNQQQVSSALDDSFSGESDVDTSSTISQRSSRNMPNATSKNPALTSGHQKERLSLGRQDLDQHSQHSTQENRRPTDSGGKVSDLGRKPTVPRSFAKHGFNDNSDYNQRQWPDSVTSDQEYSSTRRKCVVPSQKEDSGKSGRNSVAQALARSNSLTAPRPTRTSVLRRARLGEASDNEGAEVDRTSQNSEGSAQGSRPTLESRKLSRLDILAQPRKRTGSFNTPSDTESPSTRTGFSNRSSELSSSVRKASVPDPKGVARKTSGTTGKQPIIRGRSSSAKYASSTASSRRHQKGSDYTSTSEEEYEPSHSSTPKPKRSHNPGTSQTPVLARPTPRVQEEGHDGDAFQNWTTHSAEIARLSQDLAKDLAILAREIHDVAGDTDPQNTVTSDSMRTVKEELHNHIPEASQSFQKFPLNSTAIRDPNQTLCAQDTHTKSQVCNLEEFNVDNQMLNPVSQLSFAIRENTEMLTEKIKVLFHNKAEVWEEAEAKANAENDIPAPKTSNKEITSIYRELRRVQRQLEVINSIIEPCEKPVPSKPVHAPASSLSGLKSGRRFLKDWKPLSSLRGGGGGPSAKPSGGSRRHGLASDGEFSVV
ncbi:centrosomal protein of 170 kDa protein B isoform X2 [Denticeps clupeoides]|uniref:FHA domain-containing protein n=1 Tax=Denticeps clupeoides TaxID=299321 RepID=A0AAY4D0H0_9TELE|nr:centrosomal protein of 170 kDa protein B-like isoform X2 [Denticeps clupeoides]